MSLTINMEEDKIMGDNTVINSCANLFDIIHWLNKHTK